MQFLRTFGLLLLLVMGNAGIASANIISLPQFQEDQIDYQITEDLQDLSESTLNTRAEVQKIRSFFPAVLVPEHLCPRKISRSSGYVVYSRTLIPSLGITDIIFPFHTFL